MRDMAQEEDEGFDFVCCSIYPLHGGTDALYGRNICLLCVSEIPPGFICCFWKMEVGLLLVKLLFASKRRRVVFSVCMIATWTI